MVKNKKLRRMRARKTICAIFALATAMPFLSIIGSNLKTKLVDLLPLKAVDVVDKFDNTDEPAGYISAPKDSLYRDSTTNVLYTKPTTNAAGKTTVSVTINIAKPWGKNIKAYYHLENFTAILGKDFEEPKEKYVTINKNTTSATLSITTKPSTFGVYNENSTFILSRAFRFVLDSLVDDDGKGFPVYDGKDNGYKMDNGMCKNDILCLCGHQYTYKAIEQYETGYKASDVKMFYDYKDYLTQEFGTGAGDKYENTYDIGGTKYWDWNWKDCYYDWDNPKKGGRYYSTDFSRSYARGSFRIVPYQYHSYYDKEASKVGKFGIYSDWLNRIVKTGLGHSYGSFNLVFNEDEDPKSNYYEEFYLGDYLFCSGEDQKHFVPTLSITGDSKDVIKDDHWNWCLYLRHNQESRKDDVWYVEENTLEKWNEYFKRVLNGNEEIDNDKEKYVSGYYINGKVTTKNALADGFRVVDYGKSVCKNFAGTSDSKIAWYRLPNNDKEENFGMCIFREQTGNWHTAHSGLGMSGNTFFTVLDDVAPTYAEKAAIELGSMNSEGKIRISVRFSEPVQTFEHSYFKASLGGQTVEFRPVADQLPGCDTVVYEYDTSKLTDIVAEQLTVTSAIMYDQKKEGDDAAYYAIRDFGQSGGMTIPTKDTKKYLNTQSFEVNLVKKDPVLSAIDVTSKTPKQNATAEITVSYMQQGKIYYTFVKDIGQTTVVPEFTDEVFSDANTYSSYVQVSGLSNNATVKLDMPANEKRTGEYYCFVKAVSHLGAMKTLPLKMDEGVELKSGIGPFNVDNTPPSIKVAKDPDTYNANKRTFHVEVTENQNIDKIKVNLNKTNGELSEQINTFDVKLTETAVGSHVFTGSFTLTLTDILDKYYSIPETGKHIFIPDLEYEDFSISFNAVDSAGNNTDKFEWDNEIISRSITFPLSAHDSLPVHVESVSQPSLVPDITGTKVYPEGTSITLKSTYDPNLVGYLEGSVVKLPKDDTPKTFYESHNDSDKGFSITQGNPVEKNKIVVTLNKPGNYEVVVRNKEGNYSDSFTFSISHNLQDATPNSALALESFDLVPRVDAWQLNEDSCLYYLDASAKYHQKSYNGVYDPLFSSVTAAKTYIRTNEYQDLYLVKLTGQLADYLNKSGGVSGWSKANNEQTVAREGQYWVRYKNSTWTIGSSASTSWAYYFYADSLTGTPSIDLDILNKNKVLINQIERVTDLLANNGKKIYLVDDDHIDLKTNAPKLTAGQAEITKGLTITQTLSGSPVNTIICPQDSDMYSNNVSVYNGVSTQTYRLASDMRLIMNNDTALYATLAIGEPQWFRIDCKDGTPLKEALDYDGIASSGIYKILEISSQGACQFEVYVDKDNPYAEVGRTIFDAIEGTTIETTGEVDGSFNIDFYSREFSINGVPGSKLGFEVDQYSYIAVFKGAKLQNCYFLNQINSPIKLDDGIYNLVVGDRSGNRYSFRAFVSGEDIDVQFKPNGDNSKLNVNVTNREESELLKFEVYCNNELIESDLTNPKTYAISGTYYAIVQDQYGNKVTTDPFSFTKKMPDLGLYYVIGDYQYAYKENDPNPHIIQTVGDDAISIKTDTKLKLTYNPSENGIVIYDCNSTYTIDKNRGAVTFDEPCNFNFNLYYLDSEDEYVHYDVIYDDAEPNIYGEYYSSDYDFLDTKSYNFDAENLTPYSLDYTRIIDIATGSEAKKTSTISYGSTFTSDFMYFKVSDNTQVGTLFVTRNGVEVPVTLLDQGYDGLEFYLEGEPGEYIITANDIFGKTTSLAFTLGSSIFTEAKIDGESVTPVGPIDDGVHQTLYGHSGAQITCDIGSSITLRYEDENGVHALVVIVSADGSNMFQYVYETDGVNSSIRTDRDPIAISEFPFKPFEGIDLTISKNKNKVILDYNAGELKSKLDVRISRKNEDINLYNMEFSKEFKTPKFYDCGYEITPQGAYVYVSKEVVIVDEADEISNIIVACNEYSEAFDDATFVKFDENYHFNNGFYKFIITNKYGVKQEFVAVVSDVLSVTVTETFLDKADEIYYLNDENVFKSNSTVVITGYNIARMEETSGYGILIREDTKTTFIFTQPGTYEVSILDNNNNRAFVTVIINSQQISYNEAYIFGYNEDALLMNEGYTNKALSINLDEGIMNLLGITQVFYTYEDQTYVLYGYKGGNEWATYSEATFTNAIGQNGDGIYKVYFSNQYGDVCMKEINFRKAPTLTIDRLINTAIDPESIDVNDAIENGVWSNLKVSFSTILGEEQYEFYVKSGDNASYEKQSINYFFELNNASLYGEIHYTIKYVDAYGNIYEIPVNLLRRQLSFDEKDIKLVDIDGSKYTKENFSFEFDPEDVLIEYKFNNEAEYRAYSSGDLLFKDGLYQFHMYDKSGNQAFLNFTKDSIVSFTAKIDGQEVNVYYGGVFNGTSITINSTTDENATILSARLNGNLLDAKDLKINKSGHYELLLTDRIGNVKYYHFYLFNYDVNSFDYTTPDDYVVISVYFVNENGIKLNAMDKISQNNRHIDLTDAAEGTYEIQLKNKYDNSITITTVGIDKAVPQAMLNGCNDGDITTKEISLSKLETGDVVTVYRDGEMVQRVEVGVGKDMDKITEGGHYRIVVQNKAGSIVEYNFEKLTIANGALSTLIIVGLIGVAGGFFAVLVLRNRSKNDE